MSQDGGAQGRYAGRSVAGGRYQLIDLLGEGGMASVHLAHDSALDRHVAIKTLHTELGREPAFRERFRREAQSVAKLTHPNIVSVYDTGEDIVDGTTTPYIVMEYVEGEPLGSVLDADIARFGAVPADQAIKITGDVLAALEISHEMGLVHRDIKPGNVMMSKRGTVKVMDFGIARAMQSGVSSMTQTGMVVGTPQYLSPEQALGRGVDARSDLYSVGIMLFQLVTGRLPFDAESPLAIAYAHVQEEPVAPSSLNRSLPPAVDALIARALKKNPNERFPTAEAMRAECLRVAQSLHGVAPSIVPGARTGDGAGVGAAVFAPVDQRAAPPPAHQAQTPYQQPAPPYGPPQQQPQQQHPQQQHPQQQPPQSYGYPQQGGYRTPPPGPYQQHGHPQQVSTPPPYTIAPGPSGAESRRRRGGMPVVVGSIVVAVLAVGGLVAALLMDGDDYKGSGGKSDSDKGGGEAVAASPSYRGPDTSKTIDPEECTEPHDAYDDKTKVQVPDFQYKYIDSVKSCLKAAGWGYDVVNVPENTFGKGSIIDQWPKAGTDVDKKDRDRIKLNVSTGYPE
ncbi:protein kinase domain-containing protein [Streptomyces tsukubensis]|uniref:non-specific serine/threonine protein kinase n=1 Tax=Streptomyces tsukubensis TaxID=83656 RepID=A0A1V4A197_9ACTN|nr:protein kinase [Streptomyces tsukubensis]OON72902.1 serine/threonine protein kinase [Streptomyces tsukubensis]QFR94497.1 protein kinase [Streptomyces tsukubensis]